MPELTEVKIMSDFINQNSKHRFTKAWHVEKGNNSKPFEWDHHFMFRLTLPVKNFS